MNPLKVILTILLVLGAVLAISLAVTLGVIGMGWIASRVFSDLTLFEASLIALIASGSSLIVAYRLFTFPLSITGREEEEEEEGEEEEFEPPIVPWRRSKPIDQTRSAPDRGGRQPERPKRR